MGNLIAEDGGYLDAPFAAARAGLPAVMRRLGFQPIEEGKWERRKDRCAWSVCSLPDRCPAVAEVELGPDLEGKDRTRYRIRYRVRMPGQIFAHTDARALELEIDRWIRYMRGEESGEEDVKDRERLARLTFAANLFLTMIPALILCFCLWLGSGLFLQATPTQGLIEAALVSVSAWALSLWITGKAVVQVLNRIVGTRVRYRKG
jgi:hypothetical protein